MKNITVENLKFVYEGTEKDVLNGLTTSFASGWTGIVGPNGCGKSTLLAILTGELEPTSGHISGIHATSYHCKQETTSPPDGLDEFLGSYDKNVTRLKGSLGLFELDGASWEGMSHGERKRIQLGVALGKQPELLMLDEPTNHLDKKNRDFIIQTLQQYKGIGILVSHDRELLDALCTRCVIYHGGRAFTVTGNYTEAVKTVKQEDETRQRRADSLKSTAETLKREVVRIERANKEGRAKLSKKGLSAKDHDAKAKIEKAKISNKDSSLSQKKATIEKRIGQTEEEIKSLRNAKSYADRIFFIERKAHKKTLLHEPATTLHLPGITMDIPELAIQSGDKIGILGFNGVGKSSLVNWILNENRLKYCDSFVLHQELHQQEKLDLKKQLEACSKEQFSKALQIIARLGSDAKQVLRSDRWSAGETRKVAIALAIVKQVDLLILDEPTNHLDLHSVENLERALAHCNLAILMISHDRPFVDAVCNIRWQIERTDDHSTLQVFL